MKTYTGRILDPFNLKPADIDILDIAHALSNLCRFNGHCREFYSVAQHSVLVSEQLWRHGTRTKLAGLLHDASEAYLCDIPRPIKYTPEFEAYRKIEADVQGIIYQKFGVDWSAATHERVKEQDDAVLAAEGIQFMNESYTFAKPAFHIRNKPILPLAPQLAREQFLDRYRLLLNDQAERPVA